MTVLGFLIGKSRLAEVVNACRTHKTSLENPNFDLTFGVRLADCDTARLEAIHYEWASCCDRRLFVVVSPADIQAIDRLGQLAQMFDLVVMMSTTDALSRSVEKAFPRAEHSSVGEVVAKDPLDFDETEGQPVIVLDCLDAKGVFAIGKAGAFMAAAGVTEDESAVTAAHAATDVHEGE
jgi:hypothetical protein